MLPHLLSFAHLPPSLPPSPLPSTHRFSGAQHHHYLLDFLQSVAERYRGDRRAGELVVDLLKLEVPKLFAVEGGEEEDKAVGLEFSAFLRDFISRNALKPTILGKMNVILVRDLEKFPCAKNNI